jgi:hypothetical protein
MRPGVGYIEKDNRLLSIKDDLWCYIINKAEQSICRSPRVDRPVGGRTCRCRRLFLIDKTNCVMQYILSTRRELHMRQRRSPG